MAVGSNITSVMAGLIILSGLLGCADSQLGNTVERSLEADPQLEESPAFEATTDANEENPDAAQNSEPDLTVEDNSADRFPASSTDTKETDNSNQDDKTATAATNSDKPDAQVEAVDVEELDLEGVPPDLLPYLQDLLALDLLPMSTTSVADASGSDTTPDAETASPFSQTVTRRDYARWLFQAHNTLYKDELGARIRAGISTDTPTFKDVSTQDPDFAAIQGLAEAGIIPSALTGSSTAVNFRPDALLTRETLILWKVPLDARSTLPETSPETVTEMWGFQDTASIEPLALKAIAADYQLGDLANIRRAFGYTTLFQPDKAVTGAEAAAVIWRFGTQTDGRSAADALGHDGVGE